MTRLFKAEGDATVGDVLAFIDVAAREGDCVAVPVERLPVLAVHAGLKPACEGEWKGCFVFPLAAAPRLRGGLCERAAAALLLILLSPLLLAVFALVLLVDGWPAVFSQERFGVGGRPFTMFKFRTMIRHSESLHGSLQQRHGRQGKLFKLERDPRVTRTGAFLRRTFLDELPQLVNVARGEMRLVGPRPLPASDQGHYARPFHALRLGGLPGMTGLWQVSGRNARTFDEMCLLDAFYVRNRSPALDALILRRTVALLLQQVGVKRKAEDGRE
jgi:lipopolysaccharide/colanic/teichoic acid biosynthesis glycosyltransferase